MGPSLQWRLGGGAGGIKHVMEPLTDPLAGMIKTLGTPDITPDLKRTIADGVLKRPTIARSSSSPRRKTSCWSGFFVYVLGGGRSATGAKP